MKKYFIAFLLLTFMVFLVPAGLASAAGGVTTTLTPNRETLTVGDPVRLTLEVTHPTGTQVLVPRLEQQWGEVEVRAQSGIETTVNDDGTTTTRQTIDITRFVPGQFQTPELPLTLSDETGHLTEIVAEPVALTVTPLLAEGDTTLRDIKPQADLQLPAWWPWLVSSTVVALSGAGWWLLRRRGPVMMIDSRLPYQVALDELERIAGLRLLEQGRFKEYYSLVTDCLRDYLENQHDIRAFDRTTFELKTSLRESALSAEFGRRFVSMFAESDWVKFARFTPEMELARQFVDQARILVNSTKPSEPPEENSQTGGSSLGQSEETQKSGAMGQFQMREQRRI